MNTSHGPRKSTPRHFKLILALAVVVGFFGLGSLPAHAWTVSEVISAYGYEDGGIQYHSKQRYHAEQGTIRFNPSHVAMCATGQGFGIWTYKNVSGSHVFTSRGYWGENSTDMPPPNGNPIAKSLVRNNGSHGTSTTIAAHNFYIAQQGSRIYSWCVDDSYWKGTLYF